MPKIYSFILSSIAILTFSTCYVAHNTPAAPKQEETVMIYPSEEVPLPTFDYTFLHPSSDLEQTEYARKDITEDFSVAEKTDIAVRDPKLLADENSMIIDLSLMTKDDYAFPLPGAKVISPYGGRRKHHSGVDLKTCPNDTIVAAFDGIVRMAKPYAAYGNVVVIRHYNGMETIYSHNSKNFVKVGDRIKAGEPVGLTGRTGRATTEHLHFEVRINGQHFDPGKVFDLENKKLRDNCLVATKTKSKMLAIETINVFPTQNQEYKYSYWGSKTDNNKKLDL